MGNALTMEELDSSNGIIFPFYDEDTNVIFLCGKVRIQFLKIVLQTDGG